MALANVATDLGPEAAATKHDVHWLSREPLEGVQPRYFLWPPEREPLIANSRATGFADADCIWLFLDQYTVVTVASSAAHEAFHHFCQVTGRPHTEEDAQAYAARYDHRYVFMQPTIPEGITGLMSDSDLAAFLAR